MQTAGLPSYCIWTCVMMNCIHRCKSCAVPVLIYKVQLKYQVSNKEIILLIWAVIACTVPAKNCLSIWPEHQHSSCCHPLFAQHWDVTSGPCNYSDITFVNLPVNLHFYYKRELNYKLVLLHFC